MKNLRLNWRINQQIRATSVRVIDEKGKQIKIMPLNEALKLANEKGVDLIEIAPNAKPPVAKISDLGKFLYQEEKKQRQLKKKSKSPELKEVRLSPFIGEADYKTRLSKIREFLDDKNKVRVVVRFKTNQLASKKFGYELLERILKEFTTQVNLDMQPKFFGKFLIMIISPTNKSKRVYA